MLLNAAILRPRMYNGCIHVLMMCQLPLVSDLVGHEDKKGIPINGTQKTLNFSVYL